MSKTFTNGHALLVGVGGNLPNTVDDAAGLAAILQDPGRCAYPPGQLHLLTGAAATRQAVLDALDALAQAASPQDTAIVYFSGHGQQVTSSMGEDYYLLPNGYDINQLYKTAIRGAEFTARLQAIRAGRLLVLLDCCHAAGVGGGATGAKSPGLELAPAPLPPGALELLAQGGGRVLIASSLAKEYSFAGKPYSAFTLALIEALCGVDASQPDGFVRVADLALHARQVVPARTKDRQHPILHFELADNFALAYYAGGEAQPKGLPFAAPPEIEPEAGAWSKPGTTYQATVIGDGTVVQGNNNTVVGAGGVSTGGGAYIGGNIHTGGGDFVGRDKVVRADRGGIAIGGNMTGSTIGAQPAPNLEEFRRLLAEMQALLPRTGLSPQYQEELRDDLQRAERQAAALTPDRGIILKRLGAVAEFLANSATLVTSAPQLVQMAQQALTWAGRLFK